MSMLISKRILIAVLAYVLYLLLPGLANAQGVPLKSGASTDLATVNTKKALLVAGGVSTRPTYNASSSAIAPGTNPKIVVEATAGTGFKVAGYCISMPNATAAAGTVVVLQRTTSASTGGTTMTAEGTGADAIAKMDPADADYPGRAVRGYTGGAAAGAIIDQMSFQIGELGAGTADPPGNPPFCKYFGQDGASKMPTVSAGTANGMSLNVTTAPGAGALNFLALSMIIIYE